ncbi:MAG: 4-hydroxybenzoate 3-monooxygenase [Nocardioides sp.]|uniref:4-hydroxybenzoate 3-monooxygenase n=1 Tax=Nocardioides sp. TaxID=35761 RepID=UPI0039E6EFD2
MSHASRTQVAIVGGGPAGLMLSQLLHLSGIDSIVLDNRTAPTIEGTHRAGILEADSVRLLVDAGADRVLREGHRHDGISLRFAGVSHRIDFADLAGSSCWLYPQTEVFADLHRLRTATGGDLRYGIADTAVSGLGVADDTERPRIRYADTDGRSHEIVADLVVGADGSRSMCRHLVEGAERFQREYPFAWFGVLVETPPNAPELVYTRSEAGFALVSQRTETVQRLYFQCDPAERVEDWSDDRIRETLQTRVAGEDGFRLHEGPVLERSVLPFRSFVQSPMRHGRLLLAGDAAHTVPPTGAKGLNLALADVRILAETVERALLKDDADALAEYTDRALARVWRAQHFSYWMTTLLHRPPRGDQAGGFDERRQLGELASIVASRAGSTYLAEGYTGRTPS